MVLGLTQQEINQILKPIPFHSGFGVLAILVPFIISMVFTGVSVAMGDYSQVGGIALYVPENYNNMTEGQKIDYLHNQYGGEPTVTQKWGFWWNGMLPAIWMNVYTFPDGTVMDQPAYFRFIHGDADDPDYLAVTLGVLSINPPLLEEIDIYGVLIRIILIVSVCIGVVELVWIG